MKMFLEMMFWLAVVAVLSVTLLFTVPAMAQEEKAFITNLDNGMVLVLTNKKGHCTGNTIMAFVMQKTGQIEALGSWTFNNNLVQIRFQDGSFNAYRPETFTEINNNS